MSIFSLEIFPPKRTAPVGTIYDTLDGLQGLEPAFISVTYGTGKSVDRTATARIANTVRAEYGIPAVAHLTAQYLDEAGAEEALDLFDQAKVAGVLALRGDRNPEREPANVFRHASDLAAFIRERRPTCLSTAPATRRSTPRRRASTRTSTTSNARSTPASPI